MNPFFKTLSFSLRHLRSQKAEPCPTRSYGAWNTGVGSLRIEIRGEQEEIT
ncbi:MAG TPA: hypothetical protein PKA88_15885 [Polyangiaceae bacterium]|nr:hypothetical protein [Polyangiaceae bacterium]